MYMNNVKKNRTRLKMLNGKPSRFTMNKTQKNQPVYSIVQPRFPGAKGNKADKNCPGSNTKIGCQTCYGCTYSFDVSGAAFNGFMPSYGSFASINPLVDSSDNPPCEWKYNAIVQGFSNNVNQTYDKTITISIEDDRCVGKPTGVYFYSPVGGNNGVYIGAYQECGTPLPPLFQPTSIYDISNINVNNFIKTAKRMGAPYRNPIAGWRNSLNCNYKDCSGGKEVRRPTHTIYKDNYSGIKGNDINGCGACPMDCSNVMVHRPGIQGRTHRPIIRSGMQEKRPCCKTSDGKCNKKNDYSFSYRQYLNNSRCMSYERSKEKYVVQGTTNWGIDLNGKKYCKNAYRKASCCDCNCPDGKCGKAESKTIYKPSNKKFSNQGAVSSGSRLDRLKLDAIRSSNSKCIKGQRCKIIKSKFVDGADYKVPNGKYDAGNPRFTGWMFNGHHGEVNGRVYNMVRYNQTPWGIPQLTANPAGKTCIKQCFPRTLNLGTGISTAAGNRARIPGSKCDNGKCYNCSNCGTNQSGQGKPCC